MRNGSMIVLKRESGAFTRRVYVPGGATPDRAAAARDTAARALGSVRRRASPGPPAARPSGRLSDRLPWASARQQSLDAPEGLLDLVEARGGAPAPVPRRLDG